MEGKPVENKGWGNGERLTEMKVSSDERQRRMEGGGEMNRNRIGNETEE